MHYVECISRAYITCTYVSQRAKQCVTMHVTSCQCLMHAMHHAGTDAFFVRDTAFDTYDAKMHCISCFVYTG
jgi:hypothetical protein